MCPPTKSEKKLFQIKGAISIFPCALGITISVISKLSFTVHNMTNISVFCNLPDNSTCSVEGDLQGTITDLKNNISTALGLEADYFDVEYLGELPSGGQILCELGFSGDDEIDLKMTSIGFLKSKGMEYEYASNRELFLLFKKHSEDSYAMLILLRTLRADIIVSV